MEADRYGVPPDSHEDADFEFDQAAPQRPADGSYNGTLDPLAAFINGLEGICSMTDPDISDITDDLPISQERDIESMTINHVVEVDIEHIQVICEFMNALHC